MVEGQYPTLVDSEEDCRLAGGRIVDAPSFVEAGSGGTGGGDKKKIYVSSAAF
jgi:hypothetical protein